MIPWRCSLILLISFTCILALPTREGKAEDEDDDRLLFEPADKVEEEPTKLSDEDAALFKQAQEQGLGQDTSDLAQGDGARTGDDFAHDAEGDHDASKEVPKPEEENVNPGPEEPIKELHGVLMHGDTEAGQEHEHEEKAVEPEGDATVIQETVGKAGSESEERVVPDGIAKTIDTESIVHGDDADHVHDDAAPIKDDDGKDSMGGVAVESFMHDLMHDSNGDHAEEDADIKKGPAFRPRDLLKMGLDAELLKGLDIKKMIENDMEDYNKYMAETGGDEESVWNIFNSFQFRYFKDGADIDDIATREPEEEEWEESVVSNRKDSHEGEDGIQHLMERIGYAGPIVHHGSRPEDYDEEEEEEEEKEYEEEVDEEGEE